MVKTSFKEEGYELLTETYDNNKQKLEYVCKMEHRHRVTWAGWGTSRKVRCPYCANNAKLNIEFIRAEFKKEGYILLTTVYKNAHQKLEYICPRGHKHSVRWNNWKQGGRCPCFSNNTKLNIESIRAEFAKEGYILLTKVYKNAKQKLEYICPRGHRHSVNWENWNSKAKQRCPKCNNNHVSKWEKVVKKFLDKLNIDYISNDRTQLVNFDTGRSLELDIWFSQLNKAIECNGTYWHSLKKAVVRDKIKQQLCKDQGIDLLVITNEEWNKDTDKCKKKIQGFLLVCST
jgi:hypothetical protein